MTELAESLISESKFYAPFPDELGRSVRALLRKAGVEPPLRDTRRNSFDRSQSPSRLADWANQLEAYENDPDLGPHVKAIFSVVDTILIRN